MIDCMLAKLGETKNHLPRVRKKLIVNVILQKQQNSLLAGLRATNELPQEQDHSEDKAKENGQDRESEGEGKDHELRHR